MPHDDACFYPKEISWCFNIGLTNKEEQSLAADPRRHTHLHATLTSLMDTLWCWFQDKTIKAYVSSAHTMSQKCGPQSEQPNVRRVLFLCIDMKCNFIFFFFFHFSEWHMNDAKIKVSAPVMSKQPLFQLTYQHMENFPQSFSLV